MDDGWLTTNDDRRRHLKRVQHSVCPQALAHWTIALTSFSIVQQAIISGHSFCEMQHWILFETFVHICHTSWANNNVLQLKFNVMICFETYCEYNEQLLLRAVLFLLFFQTPVNSTQTKIVQLGMNEFTLKTCIRFVQKDYAAWSYLPHNTYLYFTYGWVFLFIILSSTSHTWIKPLTKFKSRSKGILFIFETCISL